MPLCFVYAPRINFCCESAVRQDFMGIMRNAYSSTKTPTNNSCVHFFSGVDAEGGHAIKQ